MTDFDFEKLDVYKCSVQFLELTCLLIDRLPRGYAYLTDQLRRAALSIPLNIAEATGKTSPQDKARFYAIARGSALEAAALVNCCASLKLSDTTLLTNARTLLIRIVQMLSKLSR